jgi:electron transfer flavoprotein beta subunit
MPMTLAELLHVPCATFARRVSAEGRRVSIERQTASGYDVVECDLPAVLTVTLGAAQPRYPSLRETIQAKKKPVERLALADLELDAGVTQSVVAVEIAPERQAGDVVDDPSDALARILGLFREASIL